MIRRFDLELADLKRTLVTMGNLVERSLEVAVAAINQPTVQAREQCLAFQQAYDIDDQHLHIAEGPADVLIPHFAQQLQAVEKAVAQAKKTLIQDHLDHCLEHIVDASGKVQGKTLDDFKLITRYL